MRWLHEQRLKQLLASRTKSDTSGLVQTAFDAALRSHLSSYMGPGRTILTKQALDIYRRRSKYKDSPARGFENLLAGLQSTRDPGVRVHSYMVDSKDYLVFTNSSTTQLHGVLIVDVRRQIEAGWFDKNGKWKTHPSKP